MQPRHMADVLRIQDQCYTDIVPESLASLRAKAVASPATCFVAEAGARVVGYVISAPIRFPQLPALNAGTFTLTSDADTLYLHDLAVGAAGRGTGAGRRLVHEVIEAGKRERLRNACLVAIQGSAPYWQQFGFAPALPAEPQLAAKLASYGVGAALMTAAL